MAGQDQRGRPRVELGSGLLVRIGGALVRAECVNVSMSGALLDLELEIEDIDVPIGSTGQLELTHRCGLERLAVSASFTVVRRDEPERSPGFARLGVQFTGMDSDSSLHLFALIRWQGG